MWNLVADKDKRQFQIVESLFHAPAPITTRQLAEQTGSSIRVIQYDLEEMKSTMDEINGKLISSMDGFKLEIPSHIGIDYFQRKIYDNTPAFNLLELIFFDDDLYLTDLENKLFMSSSTISRLVSKINEELEKYGIQITPNPFRLVGDEFLIRNFYTMYFYERYHINRWPFQQVSPEILTDALHTTFRFLKIEPNLINYGLFMFIFAIKYIRERKGYTYEKSFTYPKKILANIEAFRQAIFDDLSKKMKNEEDASFYAITFAQWVRYNPFLLDNQLYLEVPELQEEFNDILAVILKLTREFNLEMEEHRYLIFELSFVMALYKDFPGKTHVLFPPRDIFLLTYYESEFPNFYNMARVELTNICAKQNIKINGYILNHLLYTLLSKWENLTRQLFYKFSSCHILVHSHYNETHAANIANELISELDRSVHVHVYPKQFISELDLEEFDFDILLSTSTLDLDIEQPILYIHRIGLRLSLDLLREKIYEVNEKNLEKQIGLMRQ